MKYIKSSLFIGFLSITALIFAPLAKAQYYYYDNYYSYGRTPSLTVIQEGGEGTIRVNVHNADSNSRVVLNAKPFNGSFWSTTVDPIGQTDNSGNLSVLTYIGSGLGEFQVTVNGMTSNTTTLGGNNCFYSWQGCNVGGISFSNSNPNVQVGNSLSITISTPYNYYGNYYVSSNSNQNVASVSISDNNLNIYGLSAGTSTVTVCQNNQNACGTLYVTVTGSGANGNIWFSPSNPSMYVGQSLAVSVNSSVYSSNYYSSNAYYISSNSNSSVVTASISGTVLNLYAKQSGSATINVCHNSLNFCNSIYVTVTGSNNSGNIWLAQSNINLNAGQNITVAINSSNSSLGSYYVSSNSNYFAVNASVVGSGLFLEGKNQGSAAIMVCQYNSNSCASINVNVSGGNYGNNISFSQNNINLNSGQSVSVFIYGSGSYYVSSNSNPSVASVIHSSTQLSVTGQNSGSTTIVVCQNNPNACGTIYVSVNGSSYFGGTLTFNTVTLPAIIIGQYYSYQIPVSGGNSPYTFVITSGQLPVGLTLSSSGLIYGLAQNVNYSNFNVRVNDNFGRSATASFSLGSGGVLGSSTYPNGQLIKENGTVYIIYRGQKSGFSSGQVFSNFGFKFGNVLNVGYTNIPNTGYVINNSNTSHPWGAWIQSGQAVYFVHQDGLIPVPSWDVFINNRGNSSLIVPANIYDFQRPILSVMSANDSRLY